ncbi:hypothetical protein NQZ68_032254 [Dissostichus eleginoides]|nr:hypothetical protein NQZ68_032254 [Dissostichus eleginoides]
MARASLLLDLQRRKIPLAGADQNNFLGFRRKDSGKLDSQAKGFGVWSDWPDLNDLCNRTGVQLKWTRLNTQTEVPVSDELITDPSVVVKADITTPQEETVELHRDSARRVLLSMKQCEIRQHWCGLRLQGKLACLGFADHSVFKNAAVARHDRIVDIVSDAVQNILPSSAAMYKHTRVLPEWFGFTNDVFANIPNTPDVVLVDTDHREVLILEVGCAFDLYMDQAFQDKYIKYQPLLDVITSFGYKCRYSILIFGSLGHVYKYTMIGLRIAGMSKRKAKPIVKYCSVSAIIGSLAVWRRRCYVFP